MSNKLTKNLIVPPCAREGESACNVCHCLLGVRVRGAYLEEYREHDHSQRGGHEHLLGRYDLNQSI